MIKYLGSQFCKHDIDLYISVISSSNIDKLDFSDFQKERKRDKLTFIGCLTCFRYQVRHSPPNSHGR